MMREMIEVTDPTWERVVQIESKLDDLLTVLAKQWDTQERIEEKVDQLLSLSNQASQIGLLKQGR